MLSVRTCYILTFLAIGANALNNNISVVIVGAGASGIAAAARLLENNFKNVKILEAQDRIGGRIHTVDFGDTFIDVGAQYCHGEKGNVVFELTEKLNVLEDSNLTKPELFSVYTSDGKILPEDLSQDLTSAVENYLVINGSADVNLGDAVLETYNATILQKYSEKEDKLNVARNAIRLLHGIIVTYEGAFSWTSVSSISHFKECEGNPNLSWRVGGYRTILDILLKKYPNSSEALPIDDKIFLNKKVEQIIWNDTDIKLKTSDNSTFTATHVIFTPSVGVLKEQIDTLFVPHLPKTKYEAVDAIGFDGVLKIILHFPEKWWKDDDFGLGLIWNEADLLNSAKEFPDGPQKDGTSWVASISYFEKLKIETNILIAWVAFDLIPEIENTPEEVILKESNQVLKKFFGKKYKITEADKIIRSQWKTNVNIRGTYSYLRHGYYKENISYNEKLSEPLRSTDGQLQLLFAGEATHPTHHSTVHGAIESGRREAERIIRNV